MDGFGNTGRKMDAAWKRAISEGKKKANAALGRSSEMRKRVVQAGVMGTAVAGGSAAAGAVGSLFDGVRAHKFARNVGAGKAVSGMVGREVIKRGLKTSVKLGGAYGVIGAGVGAALSPNFKGSPAVKAAKKIDKRLKRAGV